MKLGIVGLGNFGTALAQHFASRGFELLAWSRNRALVDSINNQQLNPKYLTNKTLDKNLKATTEIAQLKDCQYLFLMLPANTLPGIFQQLPINEKTQLVSCMKGLATDDLTPLQYIAAQKNFNGKSFVLSGPGFANDLILGMPISIVVAGSQAASAEEFAQSFSGSNLRLYHSNDPLGVELGGILKNIFAIAAGVADGLQLGDSTRAGLVTRALSEMMRIGVALGGQKQTFFGLSGLGDLVLTATCDNSRNRQVGLRLGANSNERAGQSLDSILNDIASVAEGVKSAKKVLELASKHGVDAPITKAVNDLLESKVSPREALEQLLARSIKAEF